MDPDPSPPPRPKPSHLFGSSMGEAAPYLGLGIEITISMVFFILLGYFADRWLGTSPWLLLLGIVLSVVATGATLYRAVRDLDAAAKRQKAQREREKE